MKQVDRSDDGLQRCVAGGFGPWSGRWRDSVTLLLRGEVSIE